MSLINITKIEPFRKIQEENSMIEIYLSRRIFQADEFLTVNRKIFSVSGFNNSSYLYCFKSDRTPENKRAEIAVQIPDKETKYLDYWTDETYLTMMELSQKLNILSVEFKNIDETVRSLPMFSELRKLAKIKRKDVARKMKNIEASRASVFEKIRTEAHMNNIFG